MLTVGYYLRIVTEKLLVEHFTLFEIFHQQIPPRKIMPIKTHSINVQISSFLNTKKFTI